MCADRLVKSGVVPQQYARRFNLVSAWAEMVGYVGSIWLNALRISAALERERALSEELLRRKKVPLPVLKSAHTSSFETHRAASRCCAHTQRMFSDVLPHAIIPHSVLHNHTSQSMTQVQAISCSVFRCSQYTRQEGNP